MTYAFLWLFPKNRQFSDDRFWYRWSYRIKKVDKFSQKFDDVDLNHFRQDVWLEVLRENNVLHVFFEKSQRKLQLQPNERNFERDSKENMMRASWAMWRLKGRHGMRREREGWHGMRRERRATWSEERGKWQNGVRKERRWHGVRRERRGMRKREKGEMGDKGIPEGRHGSMKGGDSIWEGQDGSGKGDEAFLRFSFYSLVA